MHNEQPCSFSQVSPYSDVTVRRWSSLLCAVWLLPSISGPTPFDRSTTAIRMGLEGGITRAYVHVTRSGRATFELPASVGKRTLRRCGWSESLFCALIRFTAASSSCSESARSFRCRPLFFRDPYFTGGRASGPILPWVD